MRVVSLPRGLAPILYGETPFGWRLSDDRSHLVKDADEQRVLSVVRHMYLVERVAMRAIVERLGKMGIKNRRGRPFGLSGVWEMIHRRSDDPPESKNSRRKASAAKPKPGAAKGSKRRA